MVTLEDAKLYLGIDCEDAAVTANVQAALAAAEQTVRGAVGRDVDIYLRDDPRVDMLTQIYLDDLYSNRGTSAKVASATRQLVASMELQLRLELRKAREAAGDGV